MHKLRRLLKGITPYGLIELRRVWLARQQSGLKRAKALAERQQRIHATNQEIPESTLVSGADYEQVILFLINRGLPESQVRAGSIPPASLEYLEEEVFNRLDFARPIIGLHVGNFVGVSLAFMAAVLQRHNPQSMVVSVDPNLRHRGIRNPQEHVAALLSACKLQRNAMILAGYSGTKSISNDGYKFGAYDPAKEFLKEAACEATLENLHKLCAGSIDLVMMDGNHEAKYLTAEIQKVLPLLKPGAYVILDDVDESWAEIREVFSSIEAYGLKAQGTDGRVGIARLLQK